MMSSCRIETPFQQEKASTNGLIFSGSPSINGLTLGGGPSIDGWSAGRQGG
jgi:hypothetical protein